jgi:hypothetical protein
MSTSRDRKQCQYLQRHKESLAGCSQNELKFLTLPVTFIPRSETEVVPTIDTSVNAAVDDGISRARHTTTPPCTQLSGRIAESTFDVVFCHGTHKEY